MVNTNSPRRAANCRASICPIDKSLKLQAPSSKQQAPSNKRATICRIDTRCRGATICHIDTRCRGATLCLMDQVHGYGIMMTITKRNAHICAAQCEPSHKPGTFRAISRQSRDVSLHKSSPVALTQARRRVIPSPASICHIDRSSKQQASSPKLQASSFKPSLTSSLIREPRYMDIGKVFDALGPRASAMINVLCGCFTWNAI